MSSKDDQTNSPTDTNSATDAIPQWSLGASLGVNPTEFTTVKCFACKVPTLHEWGIITPTPINEPALTAVTNDFTELAHRKRRVILCTQCGLVRAIT